MGLGGRLSLTPFRASDDWSSTLVPLLYFDSPWFFLDGTEGGIKFLTLGDFRLDILGRLRFLDIPEEHRGGIRGDAFDFGFRFRLEPFPGLFADAEILTDSELRWHANLRLEKKLELYRLDLSPFLNLRYKSSEFNDCYFGLDREALGRGFDLSAGLEGRFHLRKNIYLLGKCQTTWLADDPERISLQDRNWIHEFFLGLAIMNEAPSKRKKSIGISPYLRVAQGRATRCGLLDIFIPKPDSHKNKLSSLFFGYPAAEQMFGMPLDIYLTFGCLWHWKSDVQSSSQELVVAIKAYYNFQWPVKWRIGLAEGLSYLTDIPYIESSKMKRYGYDPCKLMNYLDVSFDINVGETFGLRNFHNVYFGYAIHHRSGIFEASSQFGRTGAGSNYNTLYLQVHF